MARVYCRREDGSPAKVKRRAGVRAVCEQRAGALDADQVTHVLPRGLNMYVQWDEPVRHHIRSVQSGSENARCLPHRESAMNRTFHSSFPGRAKMCRVCGLCGERTLSECQSRQSSITACASQGTRAACRRCGELPCAALARQSGGVSSWTWGGFSEGAPR